MFVVIQWSCSDCQSFDVWFSFTAGGRHWSCIWFGIPTIFRRYVLGVFGFKCLTLVFILLRVFIKHDYNGYILFFMVYTIVCLKSLLLKCVSFVYFVSIFICTVILIHAHFTSYISSLPVNVVYVLFSSRSLPLHWPPRSWTAGRQNEAVWTDLRGAVYPLSALIRSCKRLLQKIPFIKVNLCCIIILNNLVMWWHCDICSH